LDLLFTGGGMVEQEHPMLQLTLEGIRLRDDLFKLKLGYGLSLHDCVAIEQEDGIVSLDMNTYRNIVGGPPLGLTSNSNLLYFRRDFLRNLSSSTLVIKSLFNLTTLKIAG